MKDNISFKFKLFDICYDRKLTEFWFRFFTIGFREGCSYWTLFGVFKNMFNPVNRTNTGFILTLFGHDFMFGKGKLIDNERN